MTKKQLAIEEEQKERELFKEKSKSIQEIPKVFPVGSSMYILAYFLYVCVLILRNLEAPAFDLLFSIA